MALQSGVRFKADDIWDAPEDGKRYEVIDGELYVTPPPIERHQYAGATLFGYLWQWVHPRGLGRVYSAPLGVVLDDENGLQLTSSTSHASGSASSSSAGSKGLRTWWSRSCRRAPSLATGE